MRIFSCGCVRSGVSICGGKRPGHFVRITEGGREGTLQVELYPTYLVHKLIIDTPGSGEQRDGRGLSLGQLHMCSSPYSSRSRLPCQLARGVSRVCFTACDRVENLRIERPEGEVVYP